MLFKTIYGPELKPICQFIDMAGPVEKDVLYRSFLPMVNRDLGPRANLDDAITFLTASGMVMRNDFGKYEVAETLKGSFRIQLLLRLRAIQVGIQPPSHPIDPWFLGLVEKLFVKPNRLLAFKLHQVANSIDAPEVFSEEKVNAWRRVVEYLGLGGRIASGFMCCYNHGLLADIIDLWEEREGPLQLLLEEHISRYLPWQSQEGGISDTLRIPLLILEREGHIHLEQKQDLPYKNYLGERSVKWIRKEGKRSASMYQRK